MFRSYCSSARRAFTLVELLVVISIIALLISILLPSLSAAKGAAVRVKCTAQVRQIMLGTTCYAADHRATYPQRRQPGAQTDPQTVAGGGQSWVNRRTTHGKENPG